VAANERGTNLKKESLVHRRRILFLESVAGGEYNPRTMSLTKAVMRGTKNADYDKTSSGKGKKASNRCYAYAIHRRTRDCGIR